MEIQIAHTEIKITEVTEQVRIQSILAIFLLSFENRMFLIIPTRKEYIITSYINNHKFPL